MQSILLSDTSTPSFEYHQFCINLSHQVTQWLSAYYSQHLQPELHRIAVLIEQPVMAGNNESQSWTWDILFFYTLLLQMEAFALHLNGEHKKLQFLIN